MPGAGRPGRWRASTDGSLRPACEGNAHWGRASVLRDNPSCQTWSCGRFGLLRWASDVLPFNGHAPAHGGAPEKPNLTARTRADQSSNVSTMRVIFGHCRKIKSHRIGTL